MKKTIKNVIIALLILTLSISTALLSYLHFFAVDDKDLSGDWAAELDMSKQAAFTALDWLQDIEAVSLSREEMEMCMQNLTIQVNLTFEQTGREKGMFQCSVVPESYESCSQAAYEAFAGVFRELLAERLRMAGYTGSMDEEDVEALVTETFGMSTTSYLMSCAPALLPSLEDLQAQYDGSGTYEMTQDILTRQFDADEAVITRAEYYVRNGSRLVLTEEVSSDSDGLPVNCYPVIYILKDAQD